MNDRQRVRLWADDCMRVQHRALTVLIAEEAECQRLVECQPPLDSITERSKRHIRIVHKQRHNVRRVQPVTTLPMHVAAVCSGQIPVIKSRIGLDVCCDECINEGVVVVDAGLVDATVGVYNARPRNGEAEGGQVHCFHEVDVGRVEVVRVVSHVARLPAGRLVGSVAEHVPDGRLAAVLLHRALDLVRGCAGAPV